MPGLIERYEQVKETKEPRTSAVENPYRTTELQN